MELFSYHKGLKKLVEVRDRLISFKDIPKMLTMYIKIDW